MRSEIRETPLTVLCWAINLNSPSIPCLIYKKEVIIATVQGIMKFKWIRAYYAFNTVSNLEEALEKC